MIKIANLLLVAGDGRNSGKTTLVCMLNRQFAGHNIISVKISPHFHEPSHGLIPVLRKDGYYIFEETNREGTKDSSRMLQSGSLKVYYIQVKGEFLEAAFTELMKIIPQDSPVICESPSLFRYVEPGVSIIMINKTEPNRKDISEMMMMPHYEYSLPDLFKGVKLPFLFKNKKWMFAG